MAKHRVLLILLILFILLLFAGVAVWVFRAPVLQHGIRPLLEKTASSILNAEVRIGSLVLDNDELLFTDISLRRGNDSLVFSAPAARIGFTLPDLLAGRLRSVHLLRPEMSIAPAEGKEPSGFPANPPVEVETVTIQKGRLILPASGDPIVIHGIDARSGIQEHFPFHVTAFAREGESDPFQVTGFGRWEEGLSLTLEDFQWREKPLLTEPLTVSLPSEDAAAVEGALRLDRLDSRRINEIFMILGKKSPVPQGWYFSLESPFVDFNWSESRLNLQGGFEEGALGTADMDLSLEKSQWSASRVENGWDFSFMFVLPREASGEIRGRIGDEGFNGNLRLRAPEPGELLREATDGFRPVLAGGLEIEAEFEGKENVFRIEGSFKGFSPGGEPSEHHLDLSPLAGHLTLTRKDADWQGQIAVRAGNQQIAAIEIDGMALSVGIPSLSGNIFRPLLGKDLRRLFPSDAEDLSADFRLFPEKEKWALEGKITAGKIPLLQAILAGVSIEGRLGFGEDALRFTGVRASAQLFGKSMPTAALTAAAEGSWEQGKWRLRLQPLVAEKVEYMAPDGMTALAGGRMRLTGTLSGSSTKNDITLNLSGTLRAKEILHGAFYADLADRAGELSFQGTLEPDSRQLHFRDFSLALEEIASLRLEGMLGPRNTKIEGSLNIPELKKHFSDLFLPVLRERVPATRSLKLSGELKGEFALDRNPAGGRLRGTALPSRLAISLGPLTAEGVSGAFPFDFSFGDSEGSLPSGKPRSGTLSLPRLSAGPARLENETIEVVSRPDRLEIPGAVHFRLAEGLLEIKKALYVKSTKGPEVSAEIDVRDIDLEKLTGELGWVEMQGRINADLGEIRFADGVLTSEGKMVATVFDGILLVDNIRYESPFSSYPLLYADVDFSGIDLYQLTRTFSFGAINGIADGFVHDLRLFRLTPSRFEALLETRNEGRRNISVKALNNLTLISQGGLSAALSRGLYRFIDFYRYRKIGIWCALRQDVFVLQGTAKEDSDRYLVYGGLLPPKIDIIAPTHSISFKEMLKRLQRIERTDDSGTGPDN